MKGRGIIIWLIGLGLLGLMAAYLFTQSRKNKQELEEQASRNMLLVRENLKESLEALTVEINGFIAYKLVLLSKDEDKKNAANLLKRDEQKFAFTLQDENDSKNFSYDDNLKLSSIDLNPIYERIFKRNTEDSLGIELLPDDDSLNLWIKNLKKEKVNTYLTVSLSFQQWMDGGLRKSSFFDVVFLANEKGEFLYPSGLTGSKIPNNEKLIKNSFLNSDVSHFEMDLSATTYQAYISPLKIGDKILWVGGLKNQEAINQVAYSIDYNLLVIIALVLVILLLSLPLISYYGMDKGDILSKRRVYFIGASLLMIFIVSGFVLSFIIFSPNPIEMEINRSKDVKNKLLLYFRLIQKNLNEKKNQDLDEFKSTLTINENIIADKNGVLINLEKGLDIKVDKKFDFSFINIYHRNYFKYFFDSLLIENRAIKKYYLERIFSQKDGKPELVISAKSQNNTALSALTFSFTDTLLNTTNKGYVLFKEDGEVLFASEKFEIIFTQIKTALPDNKWKKIQTIIQSNKNLEGDPIRLPLYLNGKEYTALISRFEIQNTDSPIWFIYLVNTNMYHNLTGMMVVETSIWLAMYVFILILISLLKSIIRRSKGYNWENFVYSGFHPKKIGLSNLMFGGILFIAFFITLITIFLILRDTNHFMNSVYFCIIITLFFAVFNHFFLPKRPKYTDRISTKPYSRAIFLWLFLIGFLPAFIITASIFQYETKLWGKIEENNKVKGGYQISNSDANIISLNSNVYHYYRFRASIFSAMDKGFETQLRELIFPSVNQFTDSIGNIYEEEFNVKKIGKLSLFLIILLYLSLGLIIYMLIVKLVRNIYWTDFDVKGENELGPFIRKKLSKCADMRIYLCGCDSRKNKDWIHNYLQLTIHEMEIIDCAVMNLNKPLKNLKLQNKKGLLVENIHCLVNIELFLQELPRLLKMSEGIHLIFSSGISWRKLANQLKEPSDKVRFSEILSEFYFEIVPINFELQGVPKNLNIFDEKAIKTFLINNSICSNKEDDPNMRLLLQRYGKAYFYNIWSELSIEEKNVCYSYSREGFFNFQNKDEIVELFQKGIIVKDKTKGHLRLFSKTFRYFIISIVAEQDLGKLANYRKRHANALNTQWALISFLLVAFGLLSYFDRSFLTELQAVVTGITGICALIFGELRKVWVSKTI